MATKGAHEQTDFALAAYAAGEKQFLRDRFAHRVRITHRHIAALANAYGMQQPYDEAHYLDKARAFYDGYVACYTAHTGRTWREIAP